MTDNPNYLLVYGTLRPSFTNPHAQFLREHSRCKGDITFPGLLLDLGNYPGALYQPGSATTVHGTVYSIKGHKRSILNYLDEYEGVGPRFDQPNEYVRVVIPVWCRTALIDCWIYLYNRPADGNPIIQSGDYGYYCRNK